MMMRTHAHPKPLPDNRYATYGGYWFDDLKQAYDYPSYKIDVGKGVTIATVSDGAYLHSDMTAYFGHEKLRCQALQRSMWRVDRRSTTIPLKPISICSRPAAWHPARN